jgi:RHS repeat-associated protein
LNGLYFWYSNLTGQQYYKVDSTINFNWGTGSPSGLPINGFSIRWTGRVQPKYSETYTFYLDADDGVRLWVNNTLIIDSWSYAPERSGTIALTAGQTYDIKLEYCETGGNANIFMRWASHSQAKQIIPQSQLYPSTATPTPTSTSTNTPMATATATSTATHTPTPLFNPPSGQVWRFYYFAGSQRVAVRVQGDPNPAANGLFYTLGDHLGSTSLVADSAGGKVSETRYMPWGETRHTSGYQPSDYMYTGQRAEAGIGLYYYNARWYDPSLGRFAQADIIVPNLYSVYSYDRYSYVSNNPIHYVDPSGNIQLVCEFELTNCEKPERKEPPPPQDSGNEVVAVLGGTAGGLGPTVPGPGTITKPPANLGINAPEGDPHFMGWDQTEEGFLIYPVYYVGGEDAKRAQSRLIELMDPFPILPSSVVGYSGGVDSVLFYAMNNPPNLSTIVLMGGSYQAHFDNNTFIYWETGPKPYENGFKGIIESLVTKGMNVLMISDRDTPKDFLEYNIDKPKGKFQHAFIDIAHIYIDDDLTVRGNIFDWIRNPEYYFP